MKNHKILFITAFFFALFLQGCGTDNSNQVSTSKIIGESVSLVITNPNAKMAPSRHAKEAMAKEMAKILKLHIDELNQKEAISFDKEINYCDISGIKKAQHSGNLQNIIMNIHYEACKNSHAIQDGEVQISYTQLDNNGKFPQNLTFISSNTYQFNHITLHNNTLLISKNIDYHEDGSIQAIEVEINGIIYNYSQEIELNHYQYKAIF